MQFVKVGATSLEVDKLEWQSDVNLGKDILAA
jgi:hypothetical protein